MRSRWAPGFRHQARFRGRPSVWGYPRCYFSPSALRCWFCCNWVRLTVSWGQSTGSTMGATFFYLPFSKTIPDKWSEKQCIILSGMLSALEDILYTCIAPGSPRLRAELCCEDMVNSVLILEEFLSFIQWDSYHNRAGHGFWCYLCWERLFCLVFWTPEKSLVASVSSINTSRYLLTIIVTGFQSCCHGKFLSHRGAKVIGVCTFAS